MNWEKLPLLGDTILSLGCQIIWIEKQNWSAEAFITPDSWCGWFDRLFCAPSSLISLLWFTINCVGQNKLFLSEVVFIGVFLSQQKKKRNKDKNRLTYYSRVPSRPLQPSSFAFIFGYYWFDFCNCTLIASSMFLSINGNMSFSFPDVFT